MSMFVSEYNYSLDAKGRLLLPAPFRKIIGDECVIARGLDKCLLIYTSEAWTRFYQGILELDELDENVRMLRRFYGSGATPTQLDKQGRILLNAGQKAFAGIDKDVVLVGVGDYAEIWPAERYNQFNFDNVAEVARKVREGKRKP